MKRGGTLKRRKRIKPVSDKRRRQGTAMAKAGGEILAQVYDHYGVTSTTGLLPPAAPQPKVGDLISATLRAYVRDHAQCRLCPEPAIELHHTPPRGVLGYTCDLLALPACRSCHDACHAGKVLADRQAAEVARWWRYLITHAPETAREALVELAAVEIR